MKNKIWIIISGLILVLGILAMEHQPAHADSGPEGAVRTETGNLLNTAQYTISNGVSINLIPASTRDAYIAINNVAGTVGVYLSSIAVANSGQVQNGYLLDTSTSTSHFLQLFNFTGHIYAIGPNTSSATINVLIGKTTAGGGN